MFKKNLLLLLCFALFGVARADVVEIGEQSGTNAYLPTYSFFTMTPKGQYPISVCLGTACYVRGAEKVLDELKRQLGIGVGEVTPDGKFSLTCLRCVGACGLAPVIEVGDKVYGRMTPDRVKDVLAEYK